MLNNREFSRLSQLTRFEIPCIVAVEGKCRPTFDTGECCRARLILFRASSDPGEESPAGQALARELPEYSDCGWEFPAHWDLAEKCRLVESVATPVSEFQALSQGRPLERTTG